MRELYGINITAREDNILYDGKGFEDALVSSEIIGQMQKEEERIEKALMPYTLSGSLKMIRGIAQLAVLVSLFAIIGVAFTSPDGQVLEGLLSVIHAFPALIAGALAWFVISRREKVENIKQQQDGGLNEAQEALNALRQEAQCQLKVPAEAEQIDLFKYYYKSKDGEKYLTEKGRINFMTMPCALYREGDCLYIASFEERYAIPLEAITNVRKINKMVTMNRWTKAEAFNSSDYRKYKIRHDAADRYWLESYGVMDFTLKGKQFSMRFPSYELENIERLAKY